MYFKFPQLHDVEWLTKRLQATPTRRLAREIGCDPSAINYVVRKYGIKIPYRTKHIYDPGQTVWNKGKHPDYLQGEKHWHWKGGRRLIGKGYIYIHSPNHPHATKEGYVMEHRLVMEKSLGRTLKPTEMVHHKNRNKSDNRIENLMLVKSHKEHSHVYFENAVENDELKKQLQKYIDKYGKID